MAEYKKLRRGATPYQMSVAVYNDTIDMLRWWKKQKSKTKGRKPKASSGVRSA
jgi:hypothetical protein